MKRELVFFGTLIFILALSGCAAPKPVPTATPLPKPTTSHTPETPHTQTPDATGTRMWELSFIKTLTAEPSPTLPPACGMITLGSPGTQTQDKTHRVLVQGTAVLCNRVYRDADDFYLISTPIPVAWLDLDTGTSGDEHNADVWLYYGGGSTLFHYLFDLNNAQVVGIWDDKEPTFAECKDIDKLDNTENEPAYACVRTNAGHVARIKVEKYSPFTTDSMKISFITWDDLVPTITATATVEPPITFEYCKNWGKPNAAGTWAMCNKDDGTVVFINPSNQTWPFSFNEFYKQRVPEPCAELLHATSDDQYIYFSLASPCQMIEPWFPGALGVFRINLTDGNVTRVLGVDGDFDTIYAHEYRVSISPTGRRMAYIASGTTPLMLNIVDLNTGEDQSIALNPKYSQGGRFTWSDDGKKLAMVLGKLTDESDYVFSFAFVDLLKPDSMVVFLDEKEYQWISAQIKVTDPGVSIDLYGESTSLFYDIKTGKISIIPK